MLWESAMKELMRDETRGAGWVDVVAVVRGVKHTFTAILGMFLFLRAVHEFLSLTFVLPLDEFASEEKSVPSIDTGSRRRRQGSLWGCNWDVSLSHIELERGLCQDPVRSHTADRG